MSKRKLRKLKILKMIDKNEKHNIKHQLFDVPFSLLLIGKSQLSGKSNAIGNLLLQDDGYRKIFKGENIFLVSPSVANDYKLKVIRDVLEIPDTNIMDTYNEEMIREIYKMIQEEYEEAVESKEKPNQSLIIFDDMSFGGKLKAKYSVLEKIFCNGRHIGLSVIVSSQVYTDISTSCRENSKALILFDMSDRQLERVEFDHSNIGRKKFKKMFRDTASREKHSFLCVNYSNKIKDRFLDKNFDVIDTDKL